MSSEKIRESVIAGSWYPDDPEVLKKQIANFIKVTPSPSLTGELIALIVPHAGYMYSGGVAGHAYRLLSEQPADRVLIVAPSHRAYFQGASVYQQGGYRTPLGTVPLDKDIIHSLISASPFFKYVAKAELQEHSLEIQLPFLQVLLPKFSLVPILMGDQSYESCRQLSDLIATACSGKRVLLIASTDLSHFHSYQEAKRLDQTVLDRVSAFDPEGLAEELKKGNCEACGGGPMITVMLAARRMGANKARILHYANSGDVTGDRHSVVGYMAAALFDNPGKGSKSVDSNVSRAGVDLGLSAEERQTLRKIALEAIRNRSKKRTQPASVSAEISPRLTEHRGAFVSLHKRGELRGCIGTIEGRKPLYETVREMAVQAAFHDPRFKQLKPEEIDEIELEISVLTPLKRIYDPNEIEIGKHGLLIRKGLSSGLLLPQVAIDYGWDRITFLEWTCRKANLPPDAWKSAETEIYVFSADIF